MQTRSSSRALRSATFAGITIALVLVVGATALTRGAGHSREPFHSLRPPCSFGDVFSGFAPGTDNGVLNRVSGTAPTRAVLHAGTGGAALSNLRVDVMKGATVVQSHVLPPTTLHGQDIAVDIDDTADDGGRLSPGRYAVYVSADVTGRNSCGEQGYLHQGRQAGFLVVS